MLKSFISRRRLLHYAAALPLMSGARAFAEDPANIGSITSIAPRMAMQGKLATTTEIVAGQGQAPMLTLGSMQALRDAIAKYEEINAGGGWPTLPQTHSDKSSNPRAILLLRQRLVREGYLDFDTLATGHAE